MVTLNPSVTLLVGSQAYLKEKALQEIKKAILKDSGEALDYKIFNGGEARTREILDYASTVPFSAPKRLIVIKDFEDLPEEDISRLLTQLTAKPPDTAHIAIDVKDDSIIRKYPALSKIARIVRFDAFTDSKLSSWIRSLVSSGGKTIEEKALRRLKELKAGDLASLAQEIDKLISFVGESNGIDIADVEDLVGKSMAPYAFDLAKAIGGRDPARALEIVSELIASGKKTYEIIGLICWHFRRILRAKLLTSEGASDADIADILGVRKYSGEFLEQARVFDIARIRAKMETLLAADLDMKRSFADPITSFEAALIKLCLA